jgi:glycopeptide antibiotics resistance protein
VFFSRRRAGLIWHDDIVNLIPLTRTISAFQETDVQGWQNFLSNLFGNIMLFVPLPVFMISLFNITRKRLIMLIGISVSVLIEVSQYFWRIGVPDIDDVLLNATGVIIGIVFWKLLIKSEIVKGNTYSHLV